MPKRGSSGNLSATDSDNRTHSSVGRTSTIARCLQGIDRRWHHLKYLSLAMYAAWILLTMTNNGATTTFGDARSGMASSELYLYSGIALAVCLVGAGVFQKQAGKLVENGYFVVAMGVLASAATYLLSGGVLADGGSPHIAFALCGVATGVGTAFVCLRIGCLYSAPPRGEVPFFLIAKSMLLCNLLFFMIVCLPAPISQAMLSLLPALASVMVLLGSGSPEVRKDVTDLVAADSLPRGYFTKLLISVAVFSIAVGVIKGFSALMQSAGDVSSQSIIVVFLSFLILGAIMLVAGAVLAVHNYEISKIYFPLMVCSCVTVILCALAGSSMGALQNIVINVGYNIFIVTVWALLSDLAERTTLSAVRAFGFGRGASALGTTVGWFVAYGVIGSGADPAAFLVPFFLVATVLVFATVLLVLGQQTVSEALERMFEGRVQASAQPSRSEAVDPQLVWDELCDRLAKEHGLTAREGEVFRLLSRGRTNGYIALDLNISQNTVKGHTRNVFAKMGVHSRQELIDIIEQKMEESQSA
ncbi:MAG TPA: hypothetical protein IAC28_09140 [Candidatus Aphodovivens excrementavium]|nr:hypothetical protein [Candidatus Aphodovivens excrementavium]